MKLVIAVYSALFVALDLYWASEYHGFIHWVFIGLAAYCAISGAGDIGSQKK